MPNELDEEREDWMRLALQCLERAFGDAEPEYAPDSIKQWNPYCEERKSP